MLQIHVRADVPYQLVEPVGGKRIGDLDMDGALMGLRSVIVEDEVVSAAHLRIRIDRFLNILSKLCVRLLAEYLRERFPKHLYARFDNDERDHRAEPGLERNAEYEVDRGRCERGGGDDGIEERILAGVFERIGIDPFAGPFDVYPESYLDEHRHCNDDERGGGIIRRFGRDDLLDRFDEGGHACVQHQQGDHHRAQILHPAVTERVLFVGLLARKLRSDDRDNGAECVGQIVDGVHHDGDGVCCQADDGLKARKEHVGDDADDPRPYYSFVPLNFCFHRLILKAPLRRRRGRPSYPQWAQSGRRPRRTCSRGTW